MFEILTILLCPTPYRQCIKYDHFHSGAIVTSVAVKAKTAVDSKSGTVHDVFGVVDSVSIAFRNSSTSSLTGLNWTMICIDPTVQHTHCRVVAFLKYQWQMASQDGHSWWECEGNFPHLPHVMALVGWVGCTDLPCCGSCFLQTTNLGIQQLKEMWYVPIDFLVTWHTICDATRLVQEIGLHACY